MEIDKLSSTVMLPTAVTLNCDLLTRKPNQYVSRPWFSWNLLQWLRRYCIHRPGFSGHCLLWPWPLTYKNSKT